MSMTTLDAILIEEARVRELTKDLLHIGTALAQALSSNVPYAKKHAEVMYWSKRRQSVNVDLKEAEDALAAAYLAHQG